MLENEIVFRKNDRSSDECRPVWQSSLPIMWLSATSHEPAHTCADQWYYTINYYLSVYFNNCAGLLSIPGFRFRDVSETNNLRNTSVLRWLDNEQYAKMHSVLDIFVAGFCIGFLRSTNSFCRHGKDLDSWLDGRTMRVGRMTTADRQWPL